jgi:hypothetical protein
MTHDTQFVRIKKLTGKDIVHLAGKHNLREIQAEIGAEGRIDATRICLNRVLSGPDSASEIAALAKQMMTDAELGNLRKDAVRGIEIIIGLPPTSKVDQSDFFDAALAWAKTFYCVPVLSAVLHRDEDAPHIHVLLLPLLDGRMQGSDLVGNRARLQAMQTSFYDQVGQRYGLSRPKSARRLSAATRSKTASLILSTLQCNPELMDGAGVEAALLALFGRDPEQLMVALGLSMLHPPKSKKSFVSIMIKPCSLEKPIGFSRRSKPIGFDVPVVEKTQTLSCVGFAPKSPPILDHAAPYHDDFIRCRDADQVGQWDGERGEFVMPKMPIKKLSVREFAVAEIRRAIRRTGRKNRPCFSSPLAIRLSATADRPPLSMTA